MLALTPGIRMRGFDVAGSHKAQQSGFDAFGLRNQNRIVIDGVDSNFSTGGFGFYMDSLTVNQFNISNAGADVENAWAGNTIVMDIKTAGTTSRPSSTPTGWGRASWATTSPPNSRTGAPARTT